MIELGDYYPLVGVVLGCGGGGSGHVAWWFGTFDRGRKKYISWRKARSVAATPASGAISAKDFRR